MAVAFHEVYTNLRNVTDGILAVVVSPPTQPLSIDNLKDQAATIKKDFDALKGLGPDIAALQKASDTFELELEQLGVNLEAMKKDLGDLGRRVSLLEKRRPAVDISGDLSFWAGSGNSNGHLGLLEDGRVVGQSAGHPVGLFKDLAVLHEGAFSFSGSNDTGPKWRVTAVVGNMLGGSGFGNQSNLSPSYAGGYAFSQGNDDIYVQDADVRFDTNISGLAFNTDVGRVAYRGSPYMFQRIDNTPYFSNARWDDGAYRLDGAILGFNFGRAKLRVVGGDSSNLLSANGVDLNPTVISNNRLAGGLSESLFGTSHGYNGVGAVPTTKIIGDVDRTLGADADIPLGSNGRLTLGYYWFEQEATYTGFGVSSQTDYLQAIKANRDNVFGGDLELGLGRFKLLAGVHQSILSENGATANNKDDQAWNASFVYTTDHWRFWGGYRQVDNSYYAPGDWGRLGILYNPANIKGWEAGTYYDVNRSLRVSAHAEWDKGNHTEFNTSVFSASPFNGSTSINSYLLRVDDRLSPNLTVYGSYEDTRILHPVASYFLGNGTSTGNPEYGWTSVGLAYGLGPGALLNFQYQFSNAGNDIFLPTVGGSNRYVGGFLSSQLTVRF